jgi:hypothetical protein
MKKVVVKALEKKQELEKYEAIMIAKRHDLHEQSIERELCLVKVKQICYPDVNINIKGYNKVVTLKRENVRFYRNLETKEIVTAPY